MRRDHRTPASIDMHMHGIEHGLLTYCGTATARSATAPPLLRTYCGCSCRLVAVAFTSSTPTYVCPVACGVIRVIRDPLPPCRTAGARGGTYVRTHGRTDAMHGLCLVCVVSVLCGWRAVVRVMADQAVGGSIIHIHGLCLVAGWLAARAAGPRPNSARGHGRARGPQCYLPATYDDDDPRSLVRW
jgi:hypothetical protein